MVISSASADGSETRPTTSSSFTSIRLQINKEIIDISSSSSSGSELSSLSEISKRLDPVLEHALSLSSPSSHSISCEDQNDDDGITPLMVACDRSCVPCLEWMFQKIEKEVNDTEGNMSDRLVLLLKIFGRPQDQSRDDRNTALHHAAAVVGKSKMTNPSASIQAMDILSKIMDVIKKTTTTSAKDDDDDDDDDDHENDEERRIETIKKSFRVHESKNSMLRLGSIRNAHGDTPLMMAAAADLGDDGDQNRNTGGSRTNDKNGPTTMTTPSSLPFNFIRYWVREVVLGEKECSDGEGDGDDACDDNSDRGIGMMVRNILEASNESGDTCLTLACNHGHTELVTYLLGIPPLHRPNLQSPSSITDVKMNSDYDKNDCLRFPVKLQAEDVFRCRTSVNRMVQALSRLPREIQNQNEWKKTRICSCLEVLEEELSRQSNQAAEQLLNEWDNEDGNSISAYDASVASKKKKKNKHKKKKTSSKTTESKQDSSSEHTENVEKNSGDGSKDCFDLLVTRQEDGKTAVRAPGRDLRMDGTGTTSWDVFEANTNRCSESLDSLLRDRVKSISTKNSNNDGAHGMDVDSFMSALCITPKSLLLSEHGMALNLSPAQLDAVQAILEQQIDNVKKAREIQERRANMKTEINRQE